MGTAAAPPVSTTFASGGNGAVAAEERRLVSALFCDMVGFTPLSERLDPEEVRELQAAYFEEMNAQVTRYGGIVEKYAGDAILALFGAPIAHENDAERAVLCALGMRQAIEPVTARAYQRWKADLAIRIGVNTGEVISGTWQVSGRSDVAVTGDAINTAARLESVAEPAEILVGTETMRLTRRAIRFGERRDLTLKGRLNTFPAYPALGPREHFGERWETSEQATPLVGRDREMVQLLDVWVRTQGGEGQLVTVVGDAGVGKSRLIAEMIDKVAGSTVVRVIRARSLSYGQTISLWLITDLLRGASGIAEQDGRDEVRAKLRVMLTGLLSSSDADTLSEALDVMGEVLGLPPGNSMVAHAGPQIRRQILVRSLRLMFGMLSERAPAILVLEDLHWIDEASENLLKELLSDVPGLRLLVLAAQRPGWTPPWSEWGWIERLTLRPLRDDDAALLAGEVLGGLRLAPELEQYVAERAGGNPFFVEEIVRSLEDTGGLEQRNGATYLAPGAAERLPSTLTEVLLARLDRLEGQVRSVAQVASVIGRSFAVRLLAKVMEREATALELPLSALQQAEIAFPRRGSDVEYVFKHVSMREVAYNTLVHKRRQQLHLATARAVAATYPVDEYVEMIAYHFSRTEEHREAFEWLERAGDRAASIYATETALGHYRGAMERLALWDAEPMLLARLDEKLGGVFSVAARHDEAVEALTQAARMYQESRDLEAAGRVTALMGVAHRCKGTPEEGIELVRPMVEVLEARGPSHALASLHLALSQLFFLVGSYGESHAAAERAADLARAIGNDVLLGDAEERRGATLMVLGHPEHGRSVLEGALSLIEAGGDLMILARCLINMGEASKIAGEIDVSRRHTERGVRIAERMGNLDYTIFNLSNLAEILMVQGDWEAAHAALERAMESAREGGQSVFFSWPLSMLGHLDLWEGDWEQAGRHLGEALALAEEAVDRQSREVNQTMLAELHVVQGRADVARRDLEALIDQEHGTSGLMLPVLASAYLLLGDLTGAEELANQAVTWTQREPLYLVDALRMQGKVLIQQGRLDEARRILAQALELARSMSYPYAEARILVEEGTACIKQGDVSQGQSRLEEALAIFERLGAKQDIQSTRQALTEVQ